MVIDVDDFRNKLYNNGMFETIGGFDNNVKIKCDAENNDLASRKNRKLVCDITMNFVEVAEEVNMQLIQANGPFNVVEL